MERLRLTQRENPEDSGKVKWSDRLVVQSAHMYTTGLIGTTSK